MKKIIYLHGFSSAGSTGTVTNLRTYLYGKDVTVLSPDIPTSPLEAVEFIKELINIEQPDLIIGTSMGAMYTELQHGFKRIMVNPSFQMAKLLTFRGLGNVEFQNKRNDGATHFKVDKKMIAEFKEVEKLLFKNINQEDKDNAYGLFGKDDKTVNNQDLFKREYGSAHLQVFDGGHNLNDKVVKRDVMPLILNILDI